MKIGDLIAHITVIAAKYRGHAKKAILDNEAMHDYRGPVLDQAVIDAVLSNFLNFLAVSWGVPLDLLAKDLPVLAKEPVPELELMLPTDNPCDSPKPIVVTSTMPKG